MIYHPHLHKKICKCYNRVPHKDLGLEDKPYKHKAKIKKEQQLKEMKGMKEKKEKKEQKEAKNERTKMDERKEDNERNNKTKQ